MITLEKEFTVVEFVNYENSIVPLGKPTKTLMSYTVIWYPEDEVGHFEAADKKTNGLNFYAEGGLWFTGSSLVDYDGIFNIPDSVLTALEEMNVNVEEMKGL